MHPKPIILRLIQYHELSYGNHDETDASRNEKFPTNMMIYELAEVIGRNPAGNVPSVLMKGWGWVAETFQGWLMGYVDFSGVGWLHNVGIGGGTPFMSYLFLTVFWFEKLQVRTFGEE